MQRYFSGVTEFNYKAENDFDQSSLIKKALKLVGLKSLDS